MTNAELMEFLSKEDSAAGVEVSVWGADGRAKRFREASLAVAVLYNQRI